MNNRQVEQAEKAKDLNDRFITKLLDEFSFMFEKEDKILEKIHNKKIKLEKLENFEIAAKEHINIISNLYRYIDNNSNNCVNNMHVPGCLKIYKKKYPMKLCMITLRIKITTMRIRIKEIFQNKINLKCNEL